MPKKQLLAVKPFTLTALSLALALTVGQAYSQTASSLQAQVQAQISAPTPLATSAQAAAPAHALLSALTQSAWQKNADYLTQKSQQSLLNAKEQANSRITPEAGTVELGASRAAQSGRGLELAYTTPLWLSHERSLSAQTFRGEAQSLESTLAVSKWRVAGQVRELYWAWRVSRSDLQFAQQHVDNAARLLGDVKKRLAAGDMTAADLKQAEIAHVNSLIAQTEAQSAERAANARLVTFTGTAINDAAIQASAESAESSELTPPSSAAPIEAHPVMRNLAVQASQLAIAKQLAVVQARSRPELTLGAGRDKGGAGEAYKTSMRVGFKFALGSAPSVQLAQATAQTRIDALQAEQVIEAQTLSAEQSLAKQRLTAVEQQVMLAQRRSEAATALLAMVQKAFSLGEFDLPTRIRTATEANEAQRQLARATLERAATNSAYKQALGLLP